MANILSKDKQIAPIGALAEGSSIRSIERMTDGLGAGDRRSAGPETARNRSSH
jgi:hypothetical protein